VARAIASFEEVVTFHGHACPGLALGYRAAAAAMRELKAGRPEDEQLVAVVENDSCAADAIQYVTGCTFGKGNLVFRDYGKHVYTFFNRESARAVRISEHYQSTDPDRQARIRDILTAPEDQILTIAPVDAAPPEPARIFRSLRCARCGETVMETRARLREGETVCIPCAEGS
jgi:formylmethanofuran dehydrogenase subunit E